MVGGLATRMCTSAAPALRIMATILVEVVPRTIEFVDQDHALLPLRWNGWRWLEPDADAGCGRGSMKRPTK